MTDRTHRSYVAQFPAGQATGHTATTGVEYQAYCHSCLWAGDITRYEPLARHQARDHANEQRQGETDE